MDALQFVQVAVAVVVPAVLLAKWLKRRRALRTLAAAHGFVFRGMLPSDKYSPYTKFEDVRRGVLLNNVMEGRWKGFDIAVFDLPRRTRKRNAAIVTLPRDGTRFQVLPVSMRQWIRDGAPMHAGEWTVITADGPALGPDVVVREAFPGSATAGVGVRTTAVLLSDPQVLLETNVGHAFVLAPRQLPPDRVPDFLDFVSSLAQALDADAANRSEP